MSQRPWVDFDEVREKISLPDVLEVFGIANQFKQRGQRWTGPCPLPSHPVNRAGGKRNDQQFVIDKRTGQWLFHCFASDHQIGGDVITFVQEMLGCDISHTRFWFFEHFGGNRLVSRKPRQAAKAKADGSEKADDTQSPSANHVAETSRAKPPDPTKPQQKLKPMSWSYELHPCDYLLKDRKLKPDTITRFGIGLCKAKPGKRRPFLDDYVAVPLFTHEQPEGSRQVGYLGRYAGELETWTDETPRYKFPKDFPRNSVVYGLREALRDSRNDQPLILVEGCFKVFWLYQEAGLSNVVASFGASVGDEQINILLSTGRHIVLFLDGNAVPAMRATAAKLIRYAFVRVIVLEEDQEPDDLSGNQLRSLLHFAY